MTLNDRQELPTELKEERSKQTMTAMLTVVSTILYVMTISSLVWGPPAHILHPLSSEKVRSSCRISLQSLTYLERRVTSVNSKSLQLSSTSVHWCSAKVSSVFCVTLSLPRVDFANKHQSNRNFRVTYFKSYIL